MTDSAQKYNYWVVGLGRVGSLVARIIDEQGQLYGITVRREQDLDRAKRFGQGVERTTEPPETLPENCVVLLCVPDTAILGVSALWAGRGAVAFVHFSGAIGRAVVQEQVRIKDVAAMHPLLSVSLGDMSPVIANGVTFGLSADGVGRDAAMQISEWFGGTVVEVQDSSREAWHLLATLASNGVYALIHVATQLAAKHGISGFDVERGLATLAAQSAHSAEEYGAVEAATGPVVRGDAGTVQKHIAVLQDDADLRTLYVELSRALIDIAEMRGVSAMQLTALRSVLESHVKQ